MAMNHLYRSVYKWQQLGDDLDGDRDVDQFGYAVDILDDGLIVVASSRPGLRLGSIGVPVEENGLRY